MRSLLDDCRRELTEIRSLVTSLDPVSQLLANTSNEVIRKYATVRRRFDYAAFIVGLYAALEQFVENLVSGYAAEISKLERYSALPKELRDKHEKKSAELLHRGRLGEGRYRALTQRGVVQNLFDCLSGSDTYALNDAAVCYHDFNLRPTEITAMLKSVGLPLAMQSIRNHIGIRQWYADVQGLDIENLRDVPLSAIEAELENLVERRNDVSHRGGSPDDLLGTSQMVELLSFVEQFCEAIYIACASRYLSFKYVEKQSLGSLEIAEGPYRDGSVIVVKAPGQDFSVGSTIFATYESGLAKWGRVVSLKLNDVPILKVENLDAEMTLGVEIDFKVSRAAKCFLAQDADDVIWPPLVAA